MSHECTAENRLNLYRAALLEPDDQKLPSRIELALKAIQEREQKLAYTPNGSVEETRKLGDALFNLRALLRVGTAWR
jgi:hypothetical protein